MCCFPCCCECCVRFDCWDTSLAGDIFYICLNIFRHIVFVLFLFLFNYCVFISLIAVDLLVLGVYTLYNKQKTEYFLRLCMEICTPGGVYIIVCVCYFLHFILHQLIFHL